MSEDYQTKFEALQREMVKLKRQMDQQKEHKLLAQAQELAELKQISRVQKDNEEQRAQFDQLKSQISTLKSNIVAKETTKTQQPELQQKERLVQIDDFARKTPSPVKDHVHRITEHKKPTRSTKNYSAVDTECERLLKEREELLQTGCYSKDDLLIRELEKQITQMKSVQ